MDRDLWSRFSLMGPNHLNTGLDPRKKLFHEPLSGMDYAWMWMFLQAVLAMTGPTHISKWPPGFRLWIAMENFTTCWDSLERCKPVFQDYWEKYRLMHSGHQVFKLAAEGALKLQCCVPVAFHGDEGTTYKKDGCLVLSFHSVVGKGTLSNKLGPVQDGHLPNLHTNFVGHAFQTRFLLAALLKDPCFGFVLLWV